MVATATRKPFGSQAHFLGRVCGAHKVYWVHNRFGWDAVLLNSHGRSVNAVNYGLPHRPTSEDTDTAVRALCNGAARKHRA